MTFMEFMQFINALLPSVGVGAVVVFGWKISGAIGELRGKMDGVERRLSNVEREVHSINEHLRRNKEDGAAA